MIKNYLFDLDGTLLPLNEDDFLEKYMTLIGKKFYELGLNPKEMVSKLWQGTKAMIENNGEETNETVFWKIFYPYTDKQDDLKSELEDFYRNEFNHVFDSTSPNTYSKKIIAALKEKGYQIYLLTNPIFPLVATKRRIEWAGLNISDFDHITTYENSNFAKPNIKYYQDIMDKFNLKPSETIMVGNDVYEDMIASELGINTYLITNCLKNTQKLEYNHFEQGSLEEFYKNYVMKD
ncbi:MAG: HAD family hydrolase [Tenericutes bacterium]|jgi:FMN phosphatase YigB (HAD superfamily)|nr:HAD family hydrolase [Mycoplasmatota bacterium]